MANIISKFLIVILALGFLGCKRVEIENGRIPAEYLTKAKEYMGEYVGKFAGQPGKLELSLNNDYITVRFIDGKSNDLLGAGCESKVGDLAYLYVKGESENPILTQATFKFDANKCQGWVFGMTLELYFSDDNSIKNLGLSIIESQTVRDVCDGPYPNYCRIEIESKYLRGHFIKSH